MRCEQPGGVRGRRGAGLFAVVVFRGGAGRPGRWAGRVLGQGRLSEFKAKIIEAQTADLSDAYAAKADVVLAAAGR